ncbi:MAG: ABC transporter substrate-binding protein [Puniceicoccales bacterium]
MGFPFHPRLRPLTILTVIGLVVVLLSCCSRPPPTLIKLGITRWPGGAFLFLAQEKQYFEKEGVRVQLVEFVSTPDAIDAYKAGEIDGMTCSTLDMVKAAEESRRTPQAFIVSDSSNGGDVIMARDDIHRPEELSGARIGCENSHLCKYLLQSALAEAKLSEEKIEIQHISQLAMEDAFLQGEVDALVTRPPVSIRLEREPGVHAIYSSSELTTDILNVIVADKTLIDQQPEAIRSVVRAWERAYKFYTKNPDLAQRMMGQRIGLRPDEFARSLEKIRLVSPEEKEHYFGEDKGLLVSTEDTHRKVCDMGICDREPAVEKLIAPAAVTTQP